MSYFNIHDNIASGTKRAACPAPSAFQLFPKVKYLKSADLDMLFSHSPLFVRRKHPFE